MKVTRKLIDQLVREEFAKMTDVEKTKAKEVKPGDEAENLEKHVDMMKALKIEEGRLEKRLRVVREQRSKLRKTIVDSIL